eukprot:4789641-Karenia_brevis.AAC.1
MEEDRRTLSKGDAALCCATSISPRNRDQRRGCKDPSSTRHLSQGIWERFEENDNCARQIATTDGGIRIQQYHG